MVGHRSAQQSVGLYSNQPIVAVAVNLFRFLGMATSYLPAWPAKGSMMNARIMISVVLVLLLSACGQDEPATQQEKTFGGQLGDSYKGMLDDARQGVEHANEQMQRNDQAVGERDQ